MKQLTSISISIKGRNWTFKLLSDRVFDKIHNNNEDSSKNSNAAMTISHQYEVHFRKSDFTPIAIKHEIGHVLHFASLVSSSNLTVDDTVELMCEVIGHHAEEIILWTSQITEQFLNHE